MNTATKLRDRPVPAAGQIILRGVRVHNLRDIQVEIPRDALTRHHGRFRQREILPRL